MTAESELTRKFRLDSGLEPDLKMFRNNRGNGWLGRAATKQTPTGRVTLAGARRVAFGLCPGASDWIGWTRIVITPDMVGREIAVFTAMEIKPKGHNTDRVRLRAQTHFIEFIRKMGGFAGFVTEPGDWRKIINR